MAVKPKKNNPAKAGAAVSKGFDTEDKWPYGIKNYILFGLAMVSMIIGFFLLGKGSMTLSVVLLVLSYCVLIPMALLMKDKPEDKSDSENAE